MTNSNSVFPNIKPKEVWLSLTNQFSRKIHILGES